MKTLLSFCRLDRGELGTNNSIFEEKEIQTSETPSVNGRVVLDDNKELVKQICKRLGGTVSVRVYYNGKLLPGDYVLHEETIDLW